MQQSLTNAKEKCSIALEIVGEHMVVALNKARVRSKHAYKYVTRKQRIKRFLTQRLDEFSADHALLFSLIENGEIKDNPEKYQKLKQSIGSTLRATKKLRSRNLVDEKTTSSFMYEYLHTKRFSQKKQ